MVRRTVKTFQIHGYNTLFVSHRISDRKLGFSGERHQRTIHRSTSSIKNNSDPLEYHSYVPRRFQLTLHLLVCFSQPFQAANMMLEILAVLPQAAPSTPLANDPKKCNTGLYANSSKHYRHTHYPAVLLAFSSPWE